VLLVIVYDENNLIYQNKNNLQSNKSTMVSNYTSIGLLRSIVYHFFLE